MHNRIIRKNQSNQLKLSFSCLSYIIYLYMKIFWTCWWHLMKSQGWAPNSLGIISWALISVSNFMAINLIAVEVFQSRPKWWTQCCTRLTVVILKSTLLCPIALAPQRHNWKFLQQSWTFRNRNFKHFFTAGFTASFTYGAPNRSKRTYLLVE